MMDTNDGSALQRDRPARTVRDAPTRSYSQETRVRTMTHPLRWDRTTNQPRFELHTHPLRLIHSQLLYPENNRNYVCDIGNHSSRKANFVFNCRQCNFDVCLECVAKPCYGCKTIDCYHNQIRISMV